MDGLFALLFATPGFVLTIVGFIMQVDSIGDFSDVGELQPSTALKPSAELSTSGVIVVIAGFALLLAAVVFFYIDYSRRVGATGQSRGMKTAGIRLISLDGRMSAGTAFGRLLLSSFISGSLCYLGFLWTLWDPQRQTWHDKVFNTVSVKV